MKSIESFEGYQKAVRERHWQRIVKQVTVILMNRMRIGEGNHLVGILGDPSSRCNQEAIRSWVEESIGSLETRDADQVSAYLEGELLSYFTDIRMRH